MNITKTNIGNKKIAVNTLIVYFQLFITIALNLLLSRLVLKALGPSDFGLYNVVGGIIALFSTISASMTVTTTRFLNFEQGKENGNVNKIFNQSILLHIVIAILVFLLLETLGLYYILNLLNVDIGKEKDALWVFQISTIVSTIGIMNVPFQSLFSVFEDFTFIAVVEITVVVFRLLGVIGLLYVSEDALKFYAVIMSGTVFFSILMYWRNSVRKWPDIVRWKLCYDWKAYKQQFHFSMWNLLGTISITSRSQGSTMLINYFFGTTVNAAYTISNLVLQQINTLVGKLDVAVAPQVTQCIGAKDYSRALYLASRVCRLCLLLMIIIVVTLYVELDFVLSIWLGDNVPEGTNVFCEYMLAIALVSSTSSGLLQYINGLGNIKWFRIQVVLWYTIAFIGGYILFVAGFYPYILIILFFLSDIMTRINQFYLLKKYYNFKVLSFLREAYFRPLVILMVLGVWVIVYPIFHFESTFERFVGITITGVISLSLAFILGLYQGEKNKIMIFLNKKLMK